MSVNIKRNGVLQKLADQTLIFNANCAQVRSGSFSTGEISADGYATVDVVFSTPMPDTNYVAILNPHVGAWTKANYMVSNKTTTGFTALCSNTYSAGMPTQGIDYYVFQLVELTGYTALQNKVSNPDSSPVENSTNLVTSGGVYDAIKNASSVFIGTSSEWESESAKTDYQVAILTDQPTVNAVDSTNGTTTVVANKNLVFKGTLEEWEALTTAEKKAYDQALITNDMDTGEVVNAVTDGDMRAVTSNAVYDAITNLTPVDAVTDGNMKPVTSNAVHDATQAVTNGTIDYTNEHGDTTLKWVKIGRTIIYNIHAFNITTGGSSAAWNINLPQEIRPVYTAEGMKSALFWSGQPAGEAYVNTGGYITIDIHGDFTSASGQLIAFV